VLGECSDKIPANSQGPPQVAAVYQDQVNRKTDQQGNTYSTTRGVHSLFFYWLNKIKQVDALGK